MKDIAENEEVSGSYWKNANDSLEAKTVKIGPVKEKKNRKKARRPRLHLVPRNCRRPHQHPRRNLNSIAKLVLS